MSVQEGAGGVEAAQGMSASSVAVGSRSPPPAAPHFSGQEELAYAEGVGQGTRLEGQEEVAPQAGIQVMHHLKLLA